MKIESQFMQAVAIQVPEDHRFMLPVHHTIPPLPINDLLQIRAAEYWLKLGEADEALRELEELGQTWNHPAAIKVRVAAIGMLARRKVTV